VLAALAVLAIKRCLIEPIYAITATTDGIVTGKISLIIPYAARLDEIGTLARAIRDMQNLMVRTNLQKAHHARLDERDSLGAKLEITKAELGAALNNMDQGLIMLDARANVILVNQQYKKMYGLTDEMVHPGCSLRDLVKVRTERGLLTGGIDDYLSVIKARIVTGEASVNEIELSDGRTIRVFERPMATGGWVATHEDFTEHRRLQRSLERTERFLVSVIENVREAVVAKDARSLRYIFVNRAAESLFGIPRSKIVGRMPREIFGPELADQIERSDAVMLRADAQPQTDLRTMETPGNGRRRMSFRRLPLSGQAGSHFLLTLIDDKTVEVATGISTPEAA
jgi:PAS domain S-box-containing protein